MNITMKKAAIKVGAMMLSLAFLMPLFLSVAVGEVSAQAPRAQTTQEPAPVRAYTTQDPAPTGLQNPLKGVDSIGGLFYAVANFVYSLSYAVIALFLIISGFKFVAAQGNEEKLKDAKKTFQYTIIGAILLIGANVITEVVRNVINQFSTTQI